MKQVVIRCKLGWWKRFRVLTRVDLQPVWGMDKLRGRKGNLTNSVGIWLEEFLESDSWDEIQVCVLGSGKWDKKIGAREERLAR